MVLGVVELNAELPGALSVRVGVAHVSLLGLRLCLGVRVTHEARSCLADHSLLEIVLSGLLLKALL